MARKKSASKKKTTSKKRGASKKTTSKKSTAKKDTKKETKEVPAPPQKLGPLARRKLYNVVPRMIPTKRKKKIG